MDNKFNVYNTSIQGQPLVAATNGNDIRALEFSAVLKQIPAKTATVVTLSASDFEQATIGHFLLAPTGTTTVSVGDDTVAQAKYLISLFDLKNTTDVRVLDFTVLASQAVSLITTGTTNVKIVNIGGATVASAPLFSSASKPGQNRMVLVQKLSDTVVQFTVLRGCCSDIDPQA